MKITLVAGGTGGHIFPALALEKELKKNGAVHKVTFLAATTSLSRWVLEQRKEDIISIPSYGFIGKGVHKKILALIFAIAGLFRSLMLLKRELPDVVCGFGGHGAFPFLMGCHIRRVPFILHEQNLIPGRATRFLSRFSKGVLISFPESQRLLPSGKTSFTGNLCREDFISYHRALTGLDYQPEGKKLIVVVGGSQGSHFLNHNLPAALLKILDGFPDLSLVHISGKKEKEILKDIYKNGGTRIKVIDFSLDMLSLFRDARILISRAGATILSEISLCGAPSILIPFADSADNHQYHNAVWFRDRGACLVVEEKDFTEELFYNTVRGLLSSPSQLKKMSSNLLKLSRPNAIKLAVERIIGEYNGSRW